MSKKKSLLLVTCIYIFSFAAAVLSAILLKDRLNMPLLNLFIADAVATVFVFIFSLIFKNASIYDPYWSVQPAFLVLCFYILYQNAFKAAHLFVLIPFAVWAVRLTINWAKGFDDLTWQDWRYTGFKTKFPRIFPLISFFGIMFMPTVMVFLGTAPLWFYITSASPSIFFSILSGAVILFAVSIQYISDEQMRAFRKRSDGTSCIEEGLWKYSRHPNYFGEICVWWGVAISALNHFALKNTFTWFVLIGASAITLLFVFISVPLMEKHIGHKAGYSGYKARVSMLLPLPQKKDREAQQD